MIDALGGIVAVGAEEAVQPAAQPTGVFVVVVVGVAAILVAVGVAAILVAVGVIGTVAAVAVAAVVAIVVPTMRVDVYLADGRGLAPTTELRS